MTQESQNTGAGQQEPSDANSETAVVRFAIQQMLAQLEVIKPVKVVKVTGSGAALAATGTVDLELLVSLIDGNNNATPAGTVYGIPYFRLQRGKSAIIADPVVGDIGFLVCADRDISNVKSKKAAATPGSRRKFSVSDGIYIGGFINPAPEQAVILGDDFVRIVDKTGNVVELKSTGIELTPSGALPVRINGNLIVTGNMQLGGLIQSVTGSPYAGNITTTGDVTAGTIGLKTHHHTQAADSHGDTEQPTGAAVA